MAAPCFGSFVHDSLVQLACLAALVGLLLSMSLSISTMVPRRMVAVSIIKKSIYVYIYIAWIVQISNYKKSKYHDIPLHFSLYMFDTQSVTILWHSHDRTMVLPRSGCLGYKGAWDWRVIMAPKAAKSKAKPRTSRSGSSSSGLSPPAATPVVRERVGSYDLLNLVKIWDDNEMVRDRVRENHNLCQTVHVEGDKEMIRDAYVEGNVSNVKANVHVLEPVIEIMGHNERLLPNLDNLIQCIDAFYRKAKKARTLEHCYQMAWSIRRMIQVVKGACYRETPPEARPISFSWLYKSYVYIPSSWGTTHYFDIIDGRHFLYRSLQSSKEFNNIYIYIYMHILAPLCYLVQV